MSPSGPVVMVSGTPVSGGPRFPRGKVAVMIESSGLFKGLPGDIIDKIAKLRVRRRLEPGAVLFHKGDPGDAL